MLLKTLKGSRLRHPHFPTKYDGKAQVYECGVFHNPGSWSETVKYVLKGTTDYNHCVKYGSWKLHSTLFVVACSAQEAIQSAKNLITQIRHKRQHPKSAVLMSFMAQKCSMYDLWSYEELLNRRNVASK